MSVANRRKKDGKMRRWGKSRTEGWGEREMGGVGDGEEGGTKRGGGAQEMGRWSAEVMGGKCNMRYALCTPSSQFCQLLSR